MKRSLIYIFILLTSLAVAQNTEGDSLRRIFSLKLSSCIDSGYCDNLFNPDHLVIGRHFFCDLYSKNSSEDYVEIHGQDTVRYVLNRLCDVFRGKDYVFRKSQLQVDFFMGKIVSFELLDHSSLYYIGINKEGEILFIDKKKIVIQLKFR